MIARAILALLLLLVIGGYLTWRMIGTGKGQHAAPRGWNDGLRPLPVAGRVIPRAAVEGRPPWEDQPPPDGYIVATGTLKDGRLESATIAVLPPLPVPAAVPALPAYVTDEIGDRSVDAWLESAYTRAMALEVAKAVSRDE